MIMMFFLLITITILIIGLSRVARGVDTLILPDRRSQGCLALRVPAPPPGTGGGVEKLRPPSKKTHYRKAFKNVTPPPPEFLLEFLKGGGGGGGQKTVKT